MSRPLPFRELDISGESDVRAALCGGESHPLSSVTTLLIAEKDADRDGRLLSMSAAADVSWRPVINRKWCMYSIYYSEDISESETDSEARRPIASPTFTFSPGPTQNSKSSGASNTSTIVLPKLKPPISCPACKGWPLRIGDAAV